MAQMFGGLRRSVVEWRERLALAASTARRRRPWIDHLGRAYERYQDRRGDRLAAAMTYFGFLSFFPLLALAYSLLGYLVGASATARDKLLEAIDSLLPGLADEVPVEKIAQAKTTAGVIGLVLLLVIGLRWVDALRESLREIWGHDPTGGRYLVNKLWDVGILGFLGLALIMSVTVSALSSAATHEVLEFLRVAVPGMGTLLRILSIAVAIGFNTLIFLVLFSRLSGTRAAVRQLLSGALFGAVGFEVLKLAATLLIAGTTHNPVYASVTVVAGLLVWIDIASRFTLFAAAWTATRRPVLRADDRGSGRMSAAPGLSSRDRDPGRDRRRDPDRDRDRDRDRGRGRDPDRGTAAAAAHPRRPRGRQR